MVAVKEKEAEGRIRVAQSSELMRFVQEVLVKVGVPSSDAHIVADCLLTANLSGIDSHGVVRLAHYIRRLKNGTIKARPALKFEQTAPASGIMDGADGLGHVITYHACTRAMEMAEEIGSGTVVVKNSSHFGMAGFYLKRIATEGYAGIMMTPTDAFLIPFGGRRAFFGTNPVAVGFPTDGIPVILDMSTTSIPFGKIALAQKEGRTIPADWGFNEKGEPETNPTEIVGLHPIAGAKGSGIAMIIDIFGSILSGMPWGPYINKMYLEMEQPRKLGHFIYVLDIKRLMPLEQFKKRLGLMLRELNAMPPAEGFDRVYYPGQIEGERRRQREAQGIPIEPGLYQELEELGERFKVPFPDGE